MNYKAPKIKIDTVQGYMAQQAVLFPSLQVWYNQELLNLHHRGLVTILPKYYGEIYSCEIQRRIDILLSKAS